VSLSELVAARRAELGLSLRALQERSGIHYSHLSKVESGSDGPGIAALAGLSRGLDLPLGELLGAAGISANLGLPSFARYLDAVVPGLGSEPRRELESVFERLTGVSVSVVPSSVSSTAAGEVPS
jgi:transcriptional regulator with XRE-family HTH domain